MRKLTDRLTNRMKTELSLTPLEQLKVNYGMQIAKSEGVKLIVLTLFYLLVGKISLFFFCFLILLPLRIFSGGLHMRTSASCFLFSFCFFALAIFILPNLYLSSQSYHFMLLISMILIALCSPVSSLRKPIISKKKYIKCKLLSVLTGAVFGLFLYGLPLTGYQYSGIWTFTLQSLQLAAAFSLEKIKVQTERRFDHGKNK